MLCGNATAGWTADLYGFELLLLCGMPPPISKTMLRILSSHGDFDKSCSAHLARQGKYFCSFAACGADGTKPRIAFGDDIRKIGERFDIIDNGRLAE